MIEDCLICGKKLNERSVQYQTEYPPFASLVTYTVSSIVCDKCFIIYYTTGQVNNSIIKKYSNEEDYKNPNRGICLCYYAYNNSIQLFDEDRNVLYTDYSGEVLFPLWFMNLQEFKLELEKLMILL